MEEQSTVILSPCVIVPSHISNINKTKMLIQCLQSLLDQTVKIKIYLSISFGSELDKTLFDRFIERIDLLNNRFLSIIYQEKQTSQFRHIENLIEIVKDKHNWIMFCDDDDTYELNRVEIFMEMIFVGYERMPEGKLFVAVYEKEEETHTERFYEYWSYCVNIDFIIQFFNKIKFNSYDYIIDHKFCDVLFATYLRCLDNTHYFTSLKIKLYNYNVNNEYSITSQIKKNKIKFGKGDNVNKIINKNINDILDNITLLTFYRNSFDTLISSTFHQKMTISKDNLKILEAHHISIKKICELLYMYNSFG